MHKYTKIGLCARYTRDRRGFLCGGSHYFGYSVWRRIMGQLLPIDCPAAGEGGGGWGADSPEAVLPVITLN